MSGGSYNKYAVYLFNLWWRRKKTLIKIVVKLIIVHLHFTSFQYFILNNFEKKIIKSKILKI